MTECDFCDEEFETDEELHIHWGQEHEDELNSHQKEKVKKAEREKENRLEAKKSKRRDLFLKSLTGITAIIFVALVLPQVLSMFQSSPFQLDRQPMLGQENASVSVVKFGDYQCGYCKKWDQNVKPQLKQEYIDSGDVKFYYLNLPVKGAKSALAARTGEYVYKNDPENFWNFHNELYDTKTKLTKTGIINTAVETTNLTKEKITEGLNSETARNELEADEKIANGNGVTSTPTVYVNGERVGNDWESLKSAVENNLE